MSKKAVKPLLLMVLFLFLIAGCGVPETDQPSPSPEPEEATETLVPSETPLPTEEPTVEPTVTSSEEATETSQPTETEPAAETPQVDQRVGKDEVVAEVKADLASRLGVDAGEISLVSVEARTWSTTALGCPEKGKMYAQVLTPGYKIILEVDGTRYDYRADEYGHFLLCNQ